MRKALEIEFQEFDSMSELSEKEAQLLQQAEKARLNAYAPYSSFKVGAAVLLNNGQIVLGNNQENAAYPSGLCAERVAIFSALANHPNAEIEVIAISAKTADLSPVPPCGACRQVLIEAEQKTEQSIRLITGHPESKILAFDKINNLLPFSFEKRHLPD